MVGWIPTSETSRRRRRRASTTRRRRRRRRRDDDDSETQPNVFHSSRTRVLRRLFRGMNQTTRRSDAATLIRDAFLRDSRRARRGVVPATDVARARFPRRTRTRGSLGKKFFVPFPRSSSSSFRHPRIDDTASNARTKATSRVR